MKRAMLDDFAVLSGWSAVTSGQAQLEISQDRGSGGAALRLDFDFAGGGGFVVARKRFSRALPDAYVFTFDVRGRAPANALEFKLVDPGGHNVWRYRENAFAFPAHWRPLRIRSSDIDFAWGPAGGGSAREIGAIEFAIVAPPGGRGSVWIANLALEDHSPASIPVVGASSALPGHEAACAFDGRTDTSWRSEHTDDPQWLVIDFGEPREYGGLVVHWDATTTPRAFAVDAADDATGWKTIYVSERPEAAHSYVYLPDGASRQLRLRLHRGDDGQGAGIAEVDVRPRDFSRSLDAFFRCIAAHEPRGSFPRYLCAEQTYWTPVSSAEGFGPHALLNEDGMLEVDRGAFSIEPFLLVDGRLVTWADVSPAATLEQRFLPIPSSAWRTKDVTLAITAFATATGNNAALYLRYRIENLRTERTRVRLFAALRPFQVTPPWQAHQAFGGIAAIERIEYRDGVVLVNGRNTIVPLTAPTAFGAVPFRRGNVTDYLRAGNVPPQRVVNDPCACASAALCYDLELDPASTADVYLAASGNADRPQAPSGRGIDAEAALVDAARQWRAKLDAVDIRVPISARAFADTFKTCVGHILVNRDGPALQAGPRRYARSWIRDGAAMAAALLRAGRAEEVRDYLRWYGSHQAPDGTVPCCVDRGGPDWLAEYDSQGELIYAVMEYFRFSCDRDFLAQMWPVVTKSVDRIEALRRRRLTVEFDGPEKRACYGLLPESVSHEGYLAHPVHAYWDDFWALRGLKDAASIAEVLGDAAEHSRLADLRDAFRGTLRASIAATMMHRNIDYVPASVELADIDPAATANAIAMLDEAQVMPPAAIERTLDEYLSNFRKRRSGEIDWINYSPYEMRIVGALVRLGRRENAFELARFFLADRRPSGWNQWPEIAWRDPRSPAHIGDMPHAWIAAEFVLAFRSMLAFERERDAALVVAAGVPAEWLASDEDVAVAGLPTWYGTLRFAMRRAANSIEMDLALDGATMPPGGIVIEPPVESPLRAAIVNGKAVARFTQSQVTVEQVPAMVRLTW